MKKKEKVKKVRMDFKSNESISFSDIKGQESAKGCLKIAAAGGT